MITSYETNPKALFLHFTGIKFRRSNLKTSDEMMSDELQNKDYLFKKIKNWERMTENY